MKRFILEATQEREGGRHWICTPGEGIRVKYKHIRREARVRTARRGCDTLTLVSRLSSGRRGGLKVFFSV